MDNEEKYLDVRERLKNLEQIKASDDFEKKLHYKIIAIESEKRKEHIKKYDENRGGFLRNLFSNRQYPWLIPAVGVTALIFFIFYITYLGKNTPENNISSTQKTEQSEQKNSQQNDSKLNEVPAAPPAITKTETENTDLKKPDLKSNKTVEEKSLAQNEVRSKTRNKADYNYGLSEQKLLTKNQSEIENIKPEIKAEDNDAKSNQNSVEEKINESGMTGIAPTSKESTPKSDDSKESSRKVATEDESQSKRLLDKLNIIDKTNLENLRNKISDN